MLLARGIPVTYIFKKIRREFLIVILYIISFTILSRTFNLSFLEIPFALPGVIGTAISIVLAFRVNQAYSRWWEARKIWGAIVNDSRSLVRQVLSFFQENGESTQEFSALKRKIAIRQMGWCYALGQNLREFDPLVNLEKFIDEDELSQLKNHDNVPNALLLAHGRDIQQAYRKGWITDIQQARIDQTLSSLCDSMGKSERIKNTVFPTLYSILLHAFLYLFIILLPLGLMDISPYVKIPAIIAIAAVFFLIEYTSFYLQKPFENQQTDTPVTSIARTIEINLRQMIGDEDVPDKVEVQGYYVM